MCDVPYTHAGNLYDIHKRNGQDRSLRIAAHFIKIPQRKK